MLVWPMAALECSSGLGLITHARASQPARRESSRLHNSSRRTNIGKTYLAPQCSVWGSARRRVVTLGATSPAATQVRLRARRARFLSVAGAVIGRALFYVLVIPTTMPGAFFWRNKGFEEHARASGLADRPQVGVAPLH